MAKDTEQLAKKEALESKKHMRRGVLGSLANLAEEITLGVTNGVSSGASTVLDKYQVRFECRGRGRFD